MSAARAPRRRAADRRAGFSLIEALVALTVAALTLTAVLALQTQIVDSQTRYQRALFLAGLRQNALQLLADVNPMETPEGELPLAGGRRLVWSARPLTTTRTNAGFPTGDGAFDVALYSVRGQVLAAGGRPLTEVTLDRIGWRRQFPAGGAAADQIP